MNTLPLNDWNSIPSPNNFRLDSSSKTRFYMDFKPTGENYSYYSANQALAGPPNPKIYDPVPLIPPIAASDYWGEKHIVPRGINTEAPFDLYSSGYAVQECPFVDSIEPFTNIVKPEFIQPELKSVDTLPSWKPGMTEGDLIDWAYNPDQLVYNIPSNIPTGKCTLTSEMKQYNNSIYTDIIQPHLYRKSEIEEPIQSNIGISFQQQQPPYLRQVDNDNVIYTEQDPRQIKYEPNPIYISKNPLNENTYDPRSYGYGTSYRSYVHPITGQVRFMYDDIDAIRKPNYIGRNNIDHHKWVQGYGVIQDKTVNLNDNIQKVEEQYKRDNLQFREELQLQYGTNRKGRWQQKQAPIHTMSMQMNSCRK
jgi:hypothetical protein